MRIADILNHLRVKNGLTQEELALKLGISASYLSLLERAKRPATKRVLRCLAGYLKLPAGYFVLQEMKLGDLSQRHRALVKELRRELVEPAFERVFAKARKPKGGRKAELRAEAEANVSSPETPSPEIPSPLVPGPEIPSPEVPRPEDEQAGPPARVAEAEGQLDSRVNEDCKI